jgi:hypothetical protein
VLVDAAALALLQPRRHEHHERALGPPRRAVACGTPARFLQRSGRRA